MTVGNGAAVRMAAVSSEWRPARSAAMKYGLALLGLLWFGSASAQGGKLPWQEYERLIEKGRTIAPLDIGSMFGDKVDLYSGALSFSATDVSLPGNNSLPVAVSRKLSVYDREKYGGSDSAFADWGLDIPNVNGVFGPNWHDNRCTHAVPPTVGSGFIYADEYWAGNYADLPGGGEMLRADVERAKPTTGGPYLWVTGGDTYFSCLTSIKNGSGEGFLAIDSNGTKYWLDHMAQYLEPEYSKYVMTMSSWGEYFDVYSNAQRRKNVLYATRVEDRSGNWVTYTYSNTATQPVKLTQIASSDGRSLSLQYNTNGYVSSVSDGARTWTYQYTGGSLSRVVLPDASSWTLSLAGLSNALIQYSTGDPRSCFSLESTISGDASGSITHPSGATATFTVGPKRVGRSNVPGICRNYGPRGTLEGDPNDDFPVFPIRWMSLIIKSKQVQGPGLTPGLWSYDLSSGWSWQYPTGESEPVCTTTTCADPVCVSDSCAGGRVMTITGPDSQWERYTFGNSYRYNEGKLLKHEVGSGPSGILRTTTHTYNYATSGQPYPVRIGASPQLRGAGFMEEYPRPLVKTETVQDGAGFVWEVDTGCTAAGVHCLDALARPTRIVRSGAVAAAPGSGPAVPPSLAPTLTAPATSSTGSYTVSWTAVSLATAYELRERLGSGSSSTIQDSSATSAVVIVNTSGSWNYEVRACNGAGCSAWSATRTVAVTLPPSGAPTLTAPASNSTNSYTVSWTSVAGATRYELDQRKDGGAWGNIQNTAATAKAMSGQAAGTYDYRVRACNDSGCGGYSALASTDVSVVALGIPALTVPSSATQGEAHAISWTSVSGATQYLLERKRNSGAYSTVYDGGGTNVSVPTAAALTGTYRYRVKACNGNGCGGYSAEKVLVVESSGTQQLQSAPQDEEGGE